MITQDEIAETFIIIDQLEEGDVIRVVPKAGPGESVDTEPGLQPWNAHFVRADVADRVVYVTQEPRSRWQASGGREERRVGIDGAFFVRPDQRVVRLASTMEDGMMEGCRRRIEAAESTIKSAKHMLEHIPAGAGRIERLKAKAMWTQERLDAEDELIEYRTVMLGWERVRLHRIRRELEAAQ